VQRTLNLCRIDLWHISRLTVSVIPDLTCTVNPRLCKVKLQISARLKLKRVNNNKCKPFTVVDRWTRGQRTVTTFCVVNSIIIVSEIIAFFLRMQFAMLLWMKMLSAPVTLTSRHASRGTVDFYIEAICSKADNIKNSCNSHNCHYVLKL